MKPLWHRRRVDSEPQAPATGSPITRPGYKRGQHPGNYGKHLPGELISRQDMGRLLAACPARGSAGIRDRALIVVLWRAGLRIGEALSLLPRDVDLETGVVRVREGKTGPRAVPIDAEAQAVIERWQRRRRELGLGPNRPLFCTISQPNPGGPLNASCFRETIKRRARKAGIQQRVHPHALRHTFAVECFREGVPVHIVRRLMGHASLQTTARYGDKAHPSELIAAIARRESWLTHQPTLPLELPAALPAANGHASASA